MDDTLILVCMSLLVIILLGVLIMFKKSKRVKAPSVRAVAPRIEKDLEVIVKHTENDENEKNKQKTRNRQKNKRKQVKKEVEDVVPKEETELVEKPLETITESLFDQYYYETPFDRLEAESKAGNIEYMLRVEYENETEKGKLAEQMEYRMAEGVSEAIYVLGVTKDGTVQGISREDIGKSYDACTKIAASVSAVATILRIRDGDTAGNYVAEVIIRKTESEGKFREVRIAVIGNVDTGKTTLLGVLSKGGLDNGRGKARANIFKHKHEIDSGRTSDIGREIVGFDNEGKILNYSSARAPSWNEICEHAAKVLSFIDLAGHEKYLKTTVFGLTGNYPDYSMLMIGSNMGVIGMTKEHYHLTLALKVPCFVVVTKIDICPPNILEQTMTMLKRLLKAPGSKKLPLVVNNADDVILAARNFNSERMAPIFQISNVTGENLDLLKMFLSLITTRKNWTTVKEEPPLLQIDNTFSVPGVGTVVSGTLMSGEIKLNDTLLHGPNQFGTFDSVVIKGIHTNRLPTKFARAGQSVSLALKKVKRSATRKGQVIISPLRDPHSIWEFDADIFVITHSTTISTNYEAVIHCGCTRQTATIIDIAGVLRAGLRGRVRFRYKYRPEFIQKGDRIIFREGKTKGIGNVHEVYAGTAPPLKK